MDASVVNIGSVVVLNDLEYSEKMEYRIVGTEEADVAENKISYESPLGKELIGKTVGSIVHVNAPMGVITYELLEIRAM
ncbi:Transcription elongation factor GreA [compost metagenome]